MSGNEIMKIIESNLPITKTEVNVVIGGIITAIFLRRNTATSEFEKIKAGEFKTVLEDLLQSGKITYTELYKANNFLDIAKLADQYYEKLPRRKRSDEYDFDWFMRFYESVGNISNEKMQDIWGRILAGEISHSNTFSLHTIDVLKNFGKDDAVLFEKICAHAICYGNMCFIPNYEEYFDESGVDYSEIMHLSELGVIYDNGMISLCFDDQKEEELPVHNGHLMMIHTLSKGKSFEIPQYPYTTVGSELAFLKKNFASDVEFAKFIQILQGRNPEFKIDIGTFNGNGIYNCM